MVLLMMLLLVCFFNVAVLLLLRVYLTNCRCRQKSIFAFFTELAPLFEQQPVLRARHTACNEPMIDLFC